MLSFKIALIIAQALLSIFLALWIIRMSRRNAQRESLLVQELDRERMRLAAVGTAALGYFHGCNDEYRSATLEDTIKLYKKYELLSKQLDVAKKEYDKQRNSAICQLPNYPWTYLEEKA